MPPPGLAEKAAPVLNDGLGGTVPPLTSTRETLMIRSAFVLALLALFAATTVDAGPFKKKKSDAKLAEKRANIDKMAADTLARLRGKSSAAATLLDRAKAHAVFDNTKVAIGVSGGGGRGVAVQGDSRTYMRMGTAGVGVGLGAQSYQVVFAFESEEAFRNFVENGWEADAGASAAAGTEGVNAEATFRNGIAFWKITEAGLMAHADIAGTKYWKNDKLN